MQRCLQLSTLKIRYGTNQLSRQNEHFIKALYTSLSSQHEIVLRSLLIKVLAWIIVVTSISRTFTLGLEGFNFQIIILVLLQRNWIKF